MNHTGHKISAPCTRLIRTCIDCLEHNNIQHVQIHAVRATILMILSVRSTAVSNTPIHMGVSPAAPYRLPNVAGVIA